MFAGIVEEMGAVTSIEKTLAGTRMTILASAVLGDLKIGDSVSVNGTCLTVVTKNERNFVVEVSPETLSATTLGHLAAGAPVNLERAMKLNERIGGHLVAGHVDGVRTIRHRHQEGNAIFFTIEAPPEILRYCVMKGSVTVDGISLTINDVTDKGFPSRSSLTRRTSPPSASNKSAHGQSRIRSHRQIRRAPAPRTKPASENHACHRHGLP